MSYEKIDIKQGIKLHKINTEKIQNKLTCRVFNDKIK